MTDRQIEVMEKINDMLMPFKIVMHPDGGGWQILKEFQEIIKEQKFINLSSLKSQSAESVNNKQ